MWNDLTNLGVSAPEKIVRTIVIYLVLAVLLRLAGKRDLAQLNSFDLVVMLLLSNVVQNAVIGQDDSLLGGIIGAVVLVSFNSAVVRASLTSEGVHRLMEGTSTVLARHGVWDQRALRREGLRPVIAVDVDPHRLVEAGVLDHVNVEHRAVRKIRRAQAFEVQPLPRRTAQRAEVFDLA